MVATHFFHTSAVEIKGKCLTISKYGSIIFVCRHQFFSGWLAVQSPGHVTCTTLGLMGAKNDVHTLGRRKKNLLSWKIVNEGLRLGGGGRGFPHPWHRHATATLC